MCFMKNNLLENFIVYLFNSKTIFYLILIVATLIVIPNIDRESLWLDEIFSATASLKTSSLDLMFSKYISRDGNPPLYYVLLFYWGKIFGSGDFEIRLLSYVVTLLGLILSYLLIKKYFSRKLAILFLFLSAFTPGVLYYAQEARMYSLLYALSSLASIIFLIFLKRIRGSQKIENMLLIYYFLVGVLICYTHHFGSLIIFLLSFVTIIYSLVLKKNRSAITILVVSIFIGILGMIWLIFQFYFVDMGNHIKQISWDRNNLKNIIFNFSTIFAVNKFGVAALLILLAPILRNFNYFLILVKKYSIILLPVLLLFLTSYLISIMIFTISERYLIVTVPLILLFISFIFNELFDNNKIFVFLYIIGLLILSVFGNYTYKKQNWRDASKYIQNKIYFSPNSKVPIKSLLDGSFDRLMFVSYYFMESKYVYSPDGPKIQDNCDLIYVDGHTNEEEIKRTLVEYNINIPYEILNFNKVFVVIKKRN